MQQGYINSLIYQTASVQKLRFPKIMTRPRMIKFLGLDHTYYKKRTSMETENTLYQNILIADVELLANLLINLLVKMSFQYRAQEIITTTLNSVHEGNYFDYQYT